MIRELSIQVFINLFYMIKALILLIFEIARQLFLKTVKPMLAFYATEVKKELKYIKNQLDNIKIFEK